jgi:hypothetical protein
MTVLSQEMNEIKHYMEQQAANEALATLCQTKGQGNGNSSNGSTNNLSCRNCGRNRNQGNAGG